MNRPDVDITWVEKYVTYAQDANDHLTATDYHFLAEVCYATAEQFTDVRATLYMDGVDAPIANYDADDPRTFTNGTYYTRKSKSFQDLRELDAAHPSDGRYVWHIDGPSGAIDLAPIRIGGQEQKTQIPETSPITLVQDGKRVEDYDGISHELPLTISWRPFTSGRSHPGTEWDDLIFVLVSDADGNVVFTGGAPGSEVGFLD